MSQTWACGPGSVLGPFKKYRLRPKEPRGPRVLRCNGMTELSDHRLIEQALGGDRAAFARLVERHYDTIYRVAYK